jgi:peroxiredoxin
MTTPTTIRPLTIGSKAPNFELSATDGQTYALHSFSDKPSLVVVFLANHCPYVGAWEDRLIAIGREYGDRDVAFVAISSNDVSKFPLDGPEKMRERAQERGYPFPYLYDEEQSVARAYGATRTPEVFVFDQERLLVYHGAIDSDWEESSGMQHYLREALNRLLSGQQIYLPETPPVGCTIKWKS